ncbi:MULTISPECIES: sensor histidine kinase KdpD [Emticicia]|uniref:sensor histidine kinase n=1 Tax=Emticicia TaxID=312278 RepID=UPI0007D8BF8D|nr:MULTISPECIES: HAMP domain-containing sensor histidine kinase [Emticicia]
MKLRHSITLQFIIVVMAILGTTMLSIYFFTNYFLEKNFSRRLNNRAETIVAWISESIEKEHELDFLEKLMANRKDQLTGEEIIVFQLDGKVIFESTKDPNTKIDKQILERVKKEKRIEFTEKDLEGVGIFQHSPTQSFLVVAMAKNFYAIEFLTQMRWMMLGLLTISIIIVGVIGWFYSKKTLEPIDKIGIELKNVFPKNLSNRLSENEKFDEIITLSQTINQLLERVEEGVRLQKMFVGNVSHELQNPLTRISSQLEVSLLKERNLEEYQNVIHSALEDITDLVKLTQNLLRLSRITTENEELLAENIRLDDLLFESKIFVMKNYPNYKIDIRLEALPEEPEHLCIFGNSALLKIAFVNLIQNACKFSPDNQVIISLSANENYKIIHFKDNGIGIAPDDIKYIFMPFYRSSKISGIRGYGIGLSLVERIIKLHNAKISVASEENKGTKFSIII